MAGGGAGDRQGGLLRGCYILSRSRASPHHQQAVSMPPAPVESFPDFLDSPPGRYVLEWEQRVLDETVADIFGFYALQLGTPGLAGLRENRMPFRCAVVESAEWPAGCSGVPGGMRTVVSRFDELPFASQSVDLVVLPHVLEFAEEPHRVLREVDRVLLPEGQVVLTGFNPASLWGLHHAMRRVGVCPFLPPGGQLISLRRIKDWLKLLSFEVQRGRFGCYLPWARTERWIGRWAFMEKAGDRWWPVLGSVYALAAVKRVHGMRLVGLVRKRREELDLSPALAPVAQCAPARIPVATQCRGPEAADDARAVAPAAAANG